MPRIRLLAFAALLAGLGAWTPARAEAPRHAPDTAAALPEVAVRVGAHDGFSRVVLDLPAGATAELAERDGQVVARLRGGQARSAPPAPRNLAGLAATGAEVTLTLAPGATWRAMKLEGRLAIDVRDPPRVAPGAGAASAPRVTWSGPPPRPRAMAAPSPPEADAVHSERPLQPDPAPAAPAEAAVVHAPAAPRPEPPAEPAAAEAPAGEHGAAEQALAERAPVGAVASAPLALSASLSGHGAALPFGATVGVAAFRRGPEAVVVFDERRPVDLAALGDDPVFASARIQLLPAGTVLRMALPPGMRVRLARWDGAWTLATAPEDSAPALRPLRPEVADGQLRFATAAAGRVVAMPDPLTGGALLVGTLRQPGEGVPLTRRTPEFDVLATFQGVAIAPASDALSLLAQPPGFALRAGPERALALAAPDADALAAADAARLTRRWDFPPLPTDALQRRLQSATETAAAAPPQARARARLAAVQAQLALGMGAEAHALAVLAVTDDPRLSAQPDAAALDAVAALLAGRLREADALLDPRLDGTDEVALWRAVRQAQGHEGAPEAAAVFAATTPLLLAYPPALRERLLPLAVETMALGGERDAARRLLDARKDDSGLDYARALLDEAEGHAAPSLATLDRLARSPDRRLRARASVRAVEQRLRVGALAPDAAAEALDKLIYAWRGDEREQALRGRVAELRAQAGNFRAALAILRETLELQAAAGERAALRARMQAVFGAAMAQDAAAGLPPLDLVSMIEENADLLPAGEAGRDLAVRLADRLAALDLPRRAEPVLEKLAAATPPGAARGELGARLAALRLGQDDPAGALLALSASVAPDLSADLTERRTIAFARATAARGQLQSALAALAALDTAAADEARAALLEAAKDWPAASAALAALVARTLPAEGALGEAQAATLLRLAAAAAQAGDEATLTRLREHDMARLPRGKTQEMFRLLTERPVRSVADLPRAAQEAAWARNFPAGAAPLATP